LLWSFVLIMDSNRSGQYRFKAMIFKALSDPVRLEILEFLRTSEKCVCEITPHVGLIQPVVSRHLKILKDCGLVSDRKDGTRRLYSIAEPKIFETIDAATPELLGLLSRRIIKQIAG
jgi:ArsR family transcriptional regulator, arsenate/arsenite/antimonite-responsive transcriptional repressor